MTKTFMTTALLIVITAPNAFAHDDAMPHHHNAETPLLLLIAAILILPIITALFFRSIKKVSK